MCLSILIIFNFFDFHQLILKHVKQITLSILSQNAYPGNLELLLQNPENLNFKFSAINCSLTIFKNGQNNF